MKQFFLIQGRLPGLNEYTKMNRANRFAANKLKQDTEDMIMWEAKAQHIQPFSSLVHLSYGWYEMNERRDLDNIAFAQKFVQDALVKAGILPGDGWKWIQGFDHKFFVDKKDPRVEIMIESV